MPAVTLAPGESPFRIKGIVVQGLFQYVAANVDGGMDAVRARIVDPRVRVFIDQPFLAATWFDFLPILDLLRAAATAAHLPAARFIAEHAAWQAERDVRGVHRLLLMLASPETVAQRLGSAFARYFDFANVSVKASGTGYSEVIVEGLPRILVPWYRCSVHAAGERILGLAGARDLRAEYSPLAVCGEKAGVPLVRFEVRRTWTR
jgi:hypothetical protein